MDKNNDQIWVVAERRRNGFTRATTELLSAALKLAAEVNFSTCALMLGSDSTDADDLKGLAHRVLSIQNPHLETYEALRYTAALGELINQRGAPAAILSGASRVGLEFMPRLAARLNAPYLSSCVDIAWKGDELTALRPVFGGKVYEELAITTWPALLTVRPGAFAAARSQDVVGEVELIEVKLPASWSCEIVEQKTTPDARVDLTEADRVVAGGRGMGEAANFSLLEELAETLGGAVGASRAVVDAGWRPHTEQVGKSGRTISPSLYIACGISGAIHHVLGMNTAKTVVAVNTDPKALIFDHADIGLVGDAKRVIPELISEIRAQKGRA